MCGIVAYVGEGDGGPVLMDCSLWPPERPTRPPGKSTMSFVSRGRPSSYSESSSPWGQLLAHADALRRGSPEELGDERNGRVAARASWGDWRIGDSCGAHRANRNRLSRAGAVPTVDVVVVSVSPPAAVGRAETERGGAFRVPPARCRGHVC